MKKSYDSILVISAGFLIIYIWVGSTWALYTSLGVLLISLLSYKAVVFINKIWFGIAHVLGFFVSKILLSIVFFIIVLPLGLLQRMVRGREKDHFRNKERKSYFTERNHTYTTEDLQNPW